MNDYINNDITLSLNEKIILEIVNQENQSFLENHQAQINQLILLQFLSDFLNGYQEYITEEDYNLINNIITCLTNNCLIPYRHFKESFPV